jgi:FMN phosphatase YigB (HAD superfamily)
MLRVVRRLKKHGLKVALVTNNGYWTKAKERSMILGDISPFDVVVESCRVGFRKPDSEIFNVSARIVGIY